MSSREYAGLDTALYQALGEAIGKVTGKPAVIDKATAVGGGSISRALLVDCGHVRCFVKLNDAGLADMFAAEADGLIALAVCSAPHVSA